jgi:hypothetical protein
MEVSLEKGERIIGIQVNYAVTDIGGLRFVIVKPHP